ncbi:MAG: creatininase family protein [Candidatus Helarchaeota archaeon]
MALNEAAYTVKKRMNKEDLHIYVISSHDISDNRIFKLLKTVPIHSGELETSLMLYLAENLVKKDKMVREEPKFPEFELLITGRPWMNSGVMGDPLKATKEKGEKIINIAIEVLAKKIKGLIEF